MGAASEWGFAMEEASHQDEQPISHGETWRAEHSGMTYAKCKEKTADPEIYLAKYPLKTKTLKPFQMNKK